MLESLPDEILAPAEKLGVPTAKVENPERTLFERRVE
jgi:hypothetical protein